MVAQGATTDRRGLDDRMARVESVLAELTALSDPAAQSLTEELLTTVLELHGAGLQRVLDVIEESPEGAVLLERLNQDNVVRNLLLLHGLHPLPLRQRVEAALETVRPFMKAHKGGVELLAVEGATVYLRLQGTCNGCSASTQTMQNAVEKAIYDAAPDIENIEVEGLAAPPAGPPAIDCLKPLPMVAASREREPATPPVRVVRQADEAPRDRSDGERVRSPSEHPSIALRPVIHG